MTRSDFNRLLAFGALTSFGRGFASPLLEPFGNIVLRTIAEARPRTSAKVERKAEPHNALREQTFAKLTEGYDADVVALQAVGFRVSFLRGSVRFVRAEVERGGEKVELDWYHWTCCQFFEPRVQNGALALHPFDAAHGALQRLWRFRPTDYVRLLEADESLQPLGLLMGAGMSLFRPFQTFPSWPRPKDFEACKAAIARADVATLGGRWDEVVARAKTLSAALPEAWLGAALLDAKSGALARLDKAALEVALARKTIRPLWPRLGLPVPEVSTDC